MLVLTRKQQQQIKIGDSIIVTILRLKGNTVRVGIEAPTGVRILRGELLDGELQSGEAGSAGEDEEAPSPANEPSVRGSASCSPISLAVFRGGRRSEPADWYEAAGVAVQ